MSIIVEHISKTFGEQNALQDVSFSINKGEIVGFIGPNGAGKSTMMKIICGFIPCTKGKVLVNNYNILEYPLQAKQSIGYLPEHNPLYLDMYVKEFLLYVGGIFNIPSLFNTIDDIIQKTGLYSEAHKKIGALSKGYRQRVGLAQALIHNPQVLILDEPTSGLDPNQIIEIRNLISEVGKEKTVLMSTHILQEVEAICDRVIIINKGRILADHSAGTLNTIHSENLQIIEIEFSEKVAEHTLKSILGVIDVIPLNNNKYIIEARNEQDIRNDLFSFAVSNNYKILGMIKHEKSLEEIFQKIIKIN